MSVATAVQALAEAIGNDIGPLTTKLDGIEAGATANATNAFLLDRANHTGEQDMETISSLDSRMGMLEGSIQSVDDARAADFSFIMGYKVTKVTGKGLSTNDYTTVEKNKLATCNGAGLDNLIVIPNASGIATCDLASATYFDLTITGDTEIEFTTVPAPTNQIFSWVVKVTMGGTQRTLAFPWITWLTPGGVAPTTPAVGKIAEYIFSVTDGYTIVGRVGAYT
ncbi:hypothetical protein phiK7A1_063 [Pseudomonas phage phiK7A1]|uniref:Uncharacterized protein n=1 Tax=Pseudomonas phage phiK7A1 TaxID=2759194 RepID=A0A7H0XFR1_9CAUD|nr:hypothetical protein phiK7A1_063 [Pseudomonas phage phiK7A1]